MISMIEVFTCDKYFSICLFEVPFTRIILYNFLAKDLANMSLMNGQKHAPLNLMRHSTV